MDRDSFVMHQMLAILNNEMCLTPERHARREDALETLPRLMDSIPVGQIDLDQTLSAYFMCSYAHTPKKHNIKKSINRILRQILLDHGVQEFKQFAPRRNNKKPVCVIVTNWFTSTHVMNRCFGQSLAALKDHFHCVNICLHQTDYEAAQAFHAVKQINYGAVPFHDIIKQLIDLISNENPDVILYADIAMHPFGVMLSNLRLAPLQYSILGHPAPSHSKQIDRFIMEDGYFGYTPDYTTEPVYFYSADRFSVRPPVVRPLAHPPVNGTTRILIPCTIHKVTYPFLLTLAEIQKETGAEIHIASNATKGTAAVSEQISKIVPNMTLYPSMTYDQYLMLISQMDMFLMTYPFTGYSTVLDCISQAVPGVTMNGDDVLSHQAATMMKRCGGPSQIAASVADFKAKAIKMATNRAQRREMHDYLFDRFSGNQWKTLSIFAGKSDGIAQSVLDLYKASGR